VFLHGAAHWTAARDGTSRRASNVRHRIPLVASERGFLERPGDAVTREQNLVAAKAIAALLCADRLLLCGKLELLHLVVRKRPDSFRLLFFPGTKDGRASWPMDLGKPPTLISATQARQLMARPPKAADLNYALTLRRLMRLIESASRNGHESLEFEAPRFVLDGCVGDPIVLARQLKSKLVELGYHVERNVNTLVIRW
jgi:hypothetical protein